jgi:hypothetical protein
MHIEVIAGNQDTNKMTPVRMVMDMNNISYKLTDNFEEAS